MGKKKAKKKAAKKLRKTANKVDTWIADAGLSEGDLMLAGLAVMAKAVEKKQKKMVKKAVKTGRKIMGVGLDSLQASSNGQTPRDEEAPDEPVISYRPKGGGWYAIEVDGIEVDAAQGESEAAARAGELLHSYASLDDGSPTETGVHHLGGGWYLVVVNAVPIDRIRGKETAQERFAEIDERLRQPVS